jgi:hypothetical protein
METVDNWIDGYCRKNGLDTIAVASEALVEDFEKN